jgi:8-oxo-dGTP diphosphatase
MPEFIGTLVFIVREGQVLLIHKKTGHGAGKINAPGGKLRRGETVLQCAVRETNEEVGVTPSHLKFGCELRFVEKSGPQWLGFVFVASGFFGEPSESDEAKPFWVDIEEIPFIQMWQADAIWLPSLLGGIAVPVANFLFENGQLLAHEFVNTPPIWQDLYLGE